MQVPDTWPNADPQPSPLHGNYPADLARYNRHVQYLIDSGISLSKFIIFCAQTNIPRRLAILLYDRTKAFMSGTRVNMDIMDGALEVDTSGSTPRHGTCPPPSETVHGPANKKSKHDHVIGSELCVQQDVQVLRPLVMKLSKDVNIGAQRAKSIENMLKHASGYGTVCTEFNGWINSEVGKRANTFLCFRHGFAADTAITSVGISYPAGAKIIGPLAGSDASNIPGDFGLHDVSPNNPWHYHAPDSTWFSPLNRADYEDMSWNLNRLKFKGEGNPTQPSALIVNDAPGKAWQKMRRESTLKTNNLTVHGVAGNPSANSVVSPYDYDMVFNAGTVTFNFSNKGNGACHATVVVFKVKRSNITSVNAADWIPPTSGSAQYGVVKDLYPAIEAGVRDQFNSKLGLNSLGGDQDPYVDIMTNPLKELFPQSRHTLQSNLPYKEESRIKFAMTAGGRRNVTIKLGGDVYDPAQVPKTQPGTANTIGLPPIVDTHTYIVCISVNGLKATRLYGDHNDRLGEIIPDARLEWQAKYTESLSGCAYKADASNKIQVRGEVYDFDGATPLVADESSGVIIPLGNVVGTPGQRILHTGDKVSTSTQGTQPWYSVTPTQHGGYTLYHEYKPSTSYFYNNYPVGFEYWFYYYTHETSSDGNSVSTYKNWYAWAGGQYPNPTFTAATFTPVPHNFLHMEYVNL